jgi:hypothetical protein
MRLDFNVLWVEDQPQAVKAQKDRINRQIRKEGFRLQVEFARSVQEANTFLGNDIFGDHIDIVLMDYDLGVGARGDTGLIDVRNAFPYKDIVFYSSQGNNLLKLVADKKIQGIFCSTRDNLPDSVIGAFSALVKKVLDIDHSRGIVMGATSDIDHHINDCLTSLFSLEDTTLIKHALETIGKQMNKKRTDFDKSEAQIKALTRIADIMEKHHVYTSADRLKLLGKLLTKIGGYTGECEAMKLYNDKTIPQRNDLAHVRVQHTGFSRKLIDRNGNELTSEQMRVLRSALLNHQEMFEALAVKLKPISV